MDTTAPSGINRALSGRNRARAATIRGSLGRSPAPMRPSASVSGGTSYHSGYSELDSKDTQNPQSFVSDSISLNAAVQNMVSRDKIDIKYNPQTTSRRSRIEFPTLNMELLEKFTAIKQGNNIPQPSHEAKKNAIELIMEEAEKCGGLRSNMYSDTAIFDIYPFRTDDNVSEVLQMLYYRARTQSALFDVFVMLEQRGFVSINSLRKPYAHPATSYNISPVTALLRTFQALVDEENFELGPDKNHPVPLWNHEATLGYVRWLATMIVRGCSEVDKLFDTIAASKYLGCVNQEALNDYYSRRGSNNIDFTCNDNELAHKGRHAFGFWLPQDLGDVSETLLYEKIYDQVQIFNRIERVYKAYFSIPDKYLITEDCQATYIDEHRNEYEGDFGKHLRREAMFRSASQSLAASHARNTF